MIYVIVPSPAVFYFLRVWVRAQQDAASRKKLVWLYPFWTAVAFVESSGKPKTAGITLQCFTLPRVQTNQERNLGGFGVTY